MEAIISTGTYREFKQQLDTEITKAAEGFVKIGYLLRVAMDTDILVESGYKNVAEFAQAEYGLTKDIVSRYIGINERFSEGNYSDQLQEKYRPYGVAKLAEMLTLPDAIIDCISPHLTRKDIQDIKKEIKEEEKITELEVMMEGRDQRHQVLENNLQKAIHQYFYEAKEEYQKLNETSILDNELILDVMAPSGVAMKPVRIQGIGKLLLSIRGTDNDIELLNVRTNEKETYTWQQLHEAIAYILDPVVSTKEAWEKVYEEVFVLPEKPKVALVQQNEANKQETQKELKPKEEKKQPKTKITKGPDEEETDEDEDEDDQEEPLEEPEEDTEFEEEQEPEIIDVTETAEIVDKLPDDNQQEEYKTDIPNSGYKKPMLHEWEEALKFFVEKEEDLINANIMKRPYQLAIIAIKQMMNI